MDQRRSFLKIALCCCLWVTSLLTIGCGSGGAAPVLIPVTGTVTLDGKPLVGATLMFNPLMGTSSMGAFAVTDDEGAYTLTHLSKKPGVEEGQYGVTFSKMTQPDGSPIPSGESRAEFGMVEQVPKVYTTISGGQPAERAIVKSETDALDFNLKSNRQPVFAGRPR